MTTAAHKDPEVIDFGVEVLEEMRDLCKSLDYASLLTDDGFEVVSVPSERTQGSRIASMASSMQALSDAVSRELKLGSSEYIIIASQSGYVIQLRVPGQTLVLSTKFNDSETLGKALSISRQSANKLSTLLAA
jgi:predicted regulator of Ras-like GTPase activity (Roadblock/LC7/MglB family)